MRFCFVCSVKAAELLNSHPTHRASTAGISTDLPDAHQTAPLKPLAEASEERSDSSVASSNKAPESSAAPVGTCVSSAGADAAAAAGERRLARPGESDSDAASAVLRPGAGVAASSTKPGGGGGFGRWSDARRMSVDLAGVLPQLQPPVDTINETLERLIQTPAPAIYMDAELDIEPDLPVPERIIPEAIWKKYDKHERERQKILHGAI